MRVGYLQRLGVEIDGRALGLDLLRELQVAHMINVSFENLDVFHRRGVTTDVAHSVPKIVTRRRGGWCFELNGAFGWLLREIGFHADYVSCRVAGSDGWGPELDHCAVVVHLDGERWLTDVGFGDSSLEPIQLVSGEQQTAPRRVRCTVQGEQFTIAEQQLDGSWTDELWGSFAPLPIAAFTPRSDFLQTEPGLPWTARPFATRALSDDGSRITLRPGVVRRRVSCGEFVDIPIADDDWRTVLAAEFDLDDVLAPAPASRL